MHSFSSPMGYLYFYSNIRILLEYQQNVLVPYGVSIFLFQEMDNTLVMELYSSRPLWGIYISIRITKYDYISLSEFSSPMGYLYFYSVVAFIVKDKDICSRPLWGIYISIPCPRYPLFVKGLFSTLRGKIFF